MIGRCLLISFLCIFTGLTMAPARAQTPSPDAGALSALTRKIDAQNIKIDALSQQILKLQQTVAQLAPQSEKASASSPAAMSARETTSAPVAAGNGPTHVVTRGETLTSIARHYKVGIDDLRKLNRIEDDRKLQAGQTLAIPGASAAPTPATSPNE